MTLNKFLHFIVGLLILFYCSSVHPQIENTSINLKKSYEANRLEKAPNIDGVLDDSVWEKVPVATNFVMLAPGDGLPSRASHPTEVKIGYDDEAVFIAAYLFDNNPKKIRQEFAQRDNIPKTDYFVLDINTYNDGENQTRFVITSAGTLADAKMKGKTQDYNYNVVWEGKVSLDEQGWYAEIKIPFSALRFPNKDKQVWSIQLGREISSLNEIYVWSPVDKSVGNIPHYNGMLTGIENIDPPVRLSLYPYLSGEIENYQGEKETGLNTGMDLKYGINDAFTLDLTLVPDFGQTAFDEVELNLGPFEQAYGEKRAFFTEGTELFNKGNLFYSRRIGETPIGYSEVSEQKKSDEIIVTNPEKTRLLNALKISGRTDGGLGIGFFNATTEKESAVLKGVVDEEVREITTQPISNYNIFVLDQQLDQKSSLTLINTNVTREGHFQDANVSALLFDIFNSSSSYNFTGEAKYSHINRAGTNVNGFASQFAVSRTKGKFRYSLAHDFANEGYDINDLGISTVNNYNNFFWSTSYQIFEPQGILNKYQLQLYGNHQRRYEPDANVRTGVGTSFTAKTEENFSFGGFLDFNTKYFDYFEPRKEGRFIVYPENYIGDIWFSSDYRKNLGVDFRLGYSKFFDSPFHKTTLGLSPRLRINKKFSVLYSFNYLREKNRPSYVGVQEEIIFGLRNRESVENSIQATYNFDNSKAIQLNFRNFWSSATYDKNEFKNLTDEGHLEPVDFEIGKNINPNVDYNIWNMDISYNWRFAPGSEMIFLYRNSLFEQNKNSELSFSESLFELWKKPVTQNLSFKLIYYLEFHKIKNLFDR